MRPVLADSATEALAAMRRAAESGSPFTLVLSDVMMPGVDGYQLAEQVRQQPDLAGAAMILLSSADRRHDATRCRQSGIAACLTKPVKQSELADAILKALDRSPSSTSAEPIVRDRRPRPGLDVRSVKLSVLLVEDNATNQLLAETLLEKKGHTVVTARNGKKALAVLAERSFDVVLMDVQMPEMDGFEATARIRAQERGTGKHVPIVAMTAHAMKGDCERCLEAGMDGYVTKPIRAEELYLALASFAPADVPDPRRPEASNPADPTEAGADLLLSGTPADVLDRTALLARVGGREDRLRTIIQVFQGESAGLMAELREAIAGGHAPGLQRAAHSLKGAVGLFGAPGVVENAQKLEWLGQAGELTGAIESYGQLEEEIRKLNAALAGLLSSAPGPSRQPRP
jgi:CheY-like chemotaxis protein